MKKLLFIFAIAMAAVSAQAGYINWTCYDVTKNSTALTSGYLYMFFSGSSGDAWSEISAIKKLAGQGATKVSAAMDDAGWNGAKTALSSAAGNFGLTTAIDHQTVGLAGSTRYYAYGVIFDTTSITDESKFLIVTGSTTDYGTKTKSDSSSQTAPFSIDSQSGNTTWYDVGAVPEPFSGTLALLGMGAIALRRKMKKAKKA